MSYQVLACQSRLHRAVESLEDAIVRIEWRYEREAQSSVVRLERLREEMLSALALADCDSQRLHRPREGVRRSSEPYVPGEAPSPNRDGR